MTSRVGLHCLLCSPCPVRNRPHLSGDNCPALKFRFTSDLASSIFISYFTTADTSSYSYNSYNQHLCIPSLLSVSISDYLFLSFCIGIHDHLLRPALASVSCYCHACSLVVASVYVDAKSTYIISVALLFSLGVSLRPVDP